MIDAIHQLILNYHPQNAQEIQDQKVMLEYITQFDNILTRENHYAHITASPWIVNQDFTKVLMNYHNIYQSWSWCGGHADGEADLLSVAVREASEETGLVDVQPYTKDIIALDILPVPPHTKRGAFVSAHVHLNITYLCIGHDSQELHIKADENSGVRWFDIDDVLSYVEEEDMKVVYEKLMSYVKRLKSHV